MGSPETLSPAIRQSLGLSSNEIYSKAFDLLAKVNALGAILDFGAGQGKFLNTLISSGFKNLTGADLMPKPVDSAESIHWVEHDLNQSLPLPDFSFDVIVAIEVIEHLENPRATVREWNRLLKPGGTLIFSTPNNGSIRSLLAIILRGHFVSFLERDYPAHITALTQLDMKRILEECGFKDIQFDFTEKGKVPGMGKLTWQNISLGQLSGKLFSDNIFAVATKR